ncbi:MAG: methionine adenosyltransferase [Pseudonocardiaceae bacterium]
MSTAPLAGGFVPPHDADHEVVERKGLGHPDTLADGIAELASIRYAQYCLREFGAVLHHNLDKVAVFGGCVAFGDRDGHYVRPLRIVFGGRASFSFAGTPVPVVDILSAAAGEQLRAALPGFEQVRLEVRVATTDSSKFAHWFTPRGLEDLPERTRVRCNDTAYLVGAAPRTRTEVIALLAEAWLAEHTWSGSDIKVLLARHRHRFQATVCVPALAGRLGTTAEFRDLLAAAEKSLTQLVRTHCPDEIEVEFRCNTKENTTVDGPLSGQYFTVSGSAVDYGEDGLVGRGNARHGLISPAHAAGNEVTFGKNPTYHVGKVGAWLADHAATTLSHIAGPCRVGLAWRIGAAYDDPATVQITTREWCIDDERRVREALTERDWLADLVDGQRYRPRVEPVVDLLTELAHAH